MSVFSENNKSIKLGKFIVLEGVDCCGKDTQQDKLKDFFNQEKNLKEYSEFIFVQAIDEKTLKGAKIREVIFNKDFKWNSLSEMLLFWADKFELIQEIENNLNKGINVLANRWELSNLAYQIEGKQLDTLRPFAESMRDKLEENIRPDLYILYDISTTESQKRKHSRTEMTGKFEDYYDNAKADFMNRVIKGYKNEIQKYNHIIIDAEQSVDKVFEDTLRAVKGVL